MRRIVWDEHKDAINRKKHRVSFPEASEVFFDPLLVTIVDHRHPADEMRFFSLGVTRAGRLLAVAHNGRR
ncbi:MAG: BrnT family toxin [Edaphobacter sp.]